MRTITQNVYTFAELGDDAKKRAIEKYRDTTIESGDYAWTEEIIDSMKAIFEAANVKLKDYSIGGRGTNVDATAGENANDLHGARAMAWIENNLLAGLRIPFVGKKRWSVAKYGKHYRPGTIKPCPFTGYCADDDFLDALLKSIRSGDTIKEAFESLASVAEKLIEQEQEYETSDEYIAETIEANGYEFDEDGNMA